MKREELKLPTNIPYSHTDSSDWWLSQSYVNGFHAGMRHRSRNAPVNESSERMWLMGYDDALGNLHLIDEDV